jgi:hypothetical protein
MSGWNMYFDRGLRILARHKPQDALCFFEKALKECPVSKTRELYRICFFLGVTLKRLGHSQTAIKSWLSCRRLMKRGHAGRMLARLTNHYGMERQDSENLDDWKAFASIQLSRYLLSKNRRAFSTRAEQDMVLDLIRDHWKTLVKSGALAGKACEDKHAVFRQVRIVFPALVISYGTAVDPVVSVNFKTQKRARQSERCFCGSGLPFSMCCGRIPGSEEVLRGVF